MGLALVITRFCWSHNWRMGLLLTMRRPFVTWYSLPHYRKSFTRAYQRTAIRVGLFNGRHETGEPIWI